MIGFVGSFYHYGGLDLLLEAMPAIRAERPDAAVLLVGGGPEEARLAAMTRRLGFEEAVQVVGRVPHAQVRAYYDRVDLLVYPRRRIRLTDLVTPLKPLEAMAERRLVVASNVGDHQEVIRDGGTGYLFAADDAGRSLAQCSMPRGIRRIAPPFAMRVGASSRPSETGPRLPPFTGPSMKGWCGLSAAERWLRISNSPPVPRLASGLALWTLWRS